MVTIDEKIKRIICKEIANNFNNNGFTYFINEKMDKKNEVKLEYILNHLRKFTTKEILNEFNKNEEDILTVWKENAVFYDIDQMLDSLVEESCKYLRDYPMRNCAKLRDFQKYDTLILIPKI